MSDGSVLIVCSRGKSRTKPRCSYCDAEMDVLCDGPGERPGETCEVPMCKKHAAHVPGQDLDYCREHEKMADQQTMLAL